ncbi:uncharacterized protein ACA1_100780 [Acanthamoeba castellanii str. Neff]|uniref:Diacylglycerol kinase accessory domain-containing protein n=1 Tax=Acanthamoeba castellanii (strain ATCC 30010 / Neff) TaxID=1257118 RepID=L8GGF4_ACACF|nr:uncharacterized protein ACA1_100780 [Acanthamoeba castellanii str. Neff]ELR12057.1 hypothetical protein ACA1_100780 [Acanthamoeba castellanii str. Neff]
MSSSQGKHRKPKGKQAKKAAKKEHKTAKLELKIDKLKGLLHQRQMTVIAFVNSRSGAQLGEMVMPHLAAILGEDHVFDIISDGIKPGYCSMVCRVRVLCVHRADEHGMTVTTGGHYSAGDGQRLGATVRLGGSVYPNRKKVLKLVYKFATSACLTPLDIWMVKITPKDPETLEPLENESTSQIMFNYFNAGFEAGVSYRFDRFRKRHQKLFKARKVNQIGYGLSALSSTMRGGNQSLNNLGGDVRQRQQARNARRPQDARGAQLQELSSGSRYLGQAEEGRRLGGARFLTTRSLRWWASAASDTSSRSDRTSARATIWPRGRASRSTSSPTSPSTTTASPSSSAAPVRFTWSRGAWPTSSPTPRWTSMSTSPRRACPPARPAPTASRAPPLPRRSTDKHVVPPKCK